MARQTRTVRIINELYEVIKGLNKKILDLNERISKLENKNPVDLHKNRKKIYIKDINVKTDIPTRFYYCGIYVYMYYAKQKREWRGNFKLSSGKHKEASSKDKIECFNKTIERIQLYECSLTPDDYIAEIKEVEYEDIDHENYQINSESTLYEYLLYYLFDISNVKETTKSDYLDVLKKIKGTEFQDIKVSEMDIAKVKALYSFMETSSYKMRLERIIKPAFKVLKETGIISTNPTAIFKNAKEYETEKKRIYVFKREFDDVLARIDYPHDILLVTSYYTGMRYGEIAALQIQDINFELGIITVNKEWSDRLKKIVTPKTKSSRRVIPILKPLKEYLEKYIDSIEDKSPNVFLFKRLQSNRTLRSTEYKYLSDHYVPFRIHDLRHTFCTNCYIAGVDGKLTQSWMGHTKYATTIDVYTHVPRVTKEDIKEIKEMFRPYSQE